MAFFKRALLTALFAAVSTTATGGLEDSYFAPDGPTLFKAVMPDGSAYRFEYDAQRPGHLLSAIGWTGAYDGKGNVTLQSGTGDELGFQQGRLVSAKLGGKAFSYAYDMPRHAPTNAVTPLAILLYDEKKFSENYLKREESVKWVDSGRLAFPYVNPNFSGALFAQLALLFGALALLPLRRRGVRLLFLALAAVAAGCTAWSGSRGALLGLFAGSGLAAAAVFPWRRATWRTWAAVAGVALAVLGLVLALGSENLMRGFDGQGLAWSNALRVEMTKAAPRMTRGAGAPHAPPHVGGAGGLFRVAGGGRHGRLCVCCRDRRQAAVHPVRRAARQGQRGVAPDLDRRRRAGGAWRGARRARDPRILRAVAPCAVRRVCAKHRRPAGKGRRATCVAGQVRKRLAAQAVRG